MNETNKIKAPTTRERITLRILILIGILGLVNFFYWFLNFNLIDNHFLYWLLIGVLAFDSFRITYIWYLYWAISVPKKPKLTKNLTVDVFTTFFPGEPYEMVTETLLAIQRIKYPHTSYLCDEANDPYLKKFCEEHGIRHVTRNNRINAKAGNINNALLQSTGDICLILDPDHVPKDNILDEIVPYFEDDKIGFVQSVQAYYNTEESFVAKAAAQQTFHFYGPIMMTLNSYGAVNAIGANCAFRRKALDSIGGHAPGLSEDMHTAMQLYAKGWKSVYVPDIFTKGLVPSSLAAYYKQQLKWSRGTFELLVSAYPKLFKHFTFRQKLHFAILPLYYLSGIFYLISFLIPIISLSLATTPWKGNILDFGLIYFPVFICVMGIRFYIQSWVADKSERGLHLSGGMLLASTWWVYIIGFVYTIIRKKVPYLPTPKDDKDPTNWKILIPNLVLGIASAAAVLYGLSIDLTPFSVLMSCFALLNASLMFYPVFFSDKKQKVVKLSFDSSTTSNSIFNKFKNAAYKFWHKAALPAVILILIVFANFHYESEYVKWEGVMPETQHKNSVNYLGVFAPQTDNGITKLRKAKDVANQLGEKFDIISLYIPWNKNIESNFPQSLLDSIYLQKSIPMITWEPWLNTFADELDDNKHVYELIESGYFDNYISQYAEKLRDLQKPIFLRFAHEFDNPFYPWYVNDDSASLKFKNAWIHTYEIFKNSNALNVIWVWNPWKSNNVMSYFPGEDYVDWISVNILNYGKFNGDGKWHDFKPLYAPFHDEFNNLPATPVMISEFGTLSNKGKQEEWLDKAFVSIKNDFDEIKSVIYFYSKVDNNWPDGIEKNTNLDWTFAGPQSVKSSFKSKEVPDYVFDSIPDFIPGYMAGNSVKPIALKNIKGINIKTEQDWRNNYRVLTREYLEADFEKIKHLGINTIKFDGNSIYRHNLLTISKEFGFNVSFGFWISASMDFIEDTVKIDHLKQNILNRIIEKKHYSHITSWNIQNDILYNQKHHYNKPELFYQNKSYIKWLQDLIGAMKKIDTTRPIFVDLEVNQLSVPYAKVLVENVEGIDGLGLVVKDDKYLDILIAHLRNSNIEFQFSEISAENLTEDYIFEMQESFFITAWQDVHEIDELTFSGIVDRKGRYKTDYFTLLNAIQKSNIEVFEPKVKILKPAAFLYEDRIFNYHAMYFDDFKGWQFGGKIKDLIFEWSLVKCDKYGNYLAIKDVGYGPTLQLEIPDDYRLYRLLLTTIKGDTITTSITKLHTPIIQKTDGLN